MHRIYSSSSRFSRAVWIHIASATKFGYSSWRMSASMSMNRAHSTLRRSRSWAAIPRGQAYIRKWFDAGRAPSVGTCSDAAHGAGDDKILKEEFYGIHGEWGFTGVLVRYPWYPGSFMKGKGHLPLSSDSISLKKTTFPVSYFTAFVFRPS